MSYARMDHAGWVESNGAAARGMHSRSRKVRSDNCKGWLACPERLNPFQAAAMDILGIVGGGIYNAPIAWDHLEWRSTFLIVPWDGTLSTFDHSDLTRLVLLAHEACIRIEIRPRAFRLLEICLSPRDRQGEIYSRHPTIDDAVGDFREYLGANHRTIHAHGAAGESSGVVA